MNTVFSFIAGILGFSIQENGSSIVPDFSSEAKHVGVLNNSSTDVKRSYFNAAPYSVDYEAGYFGLMSLYADAMLALEIVAKFGTFGDAAAKAAKVGIGICAGYSFLEVTIPAIVAGSKDLTDSHTMPLQKWFLDTMKVAKKSFTSIGLNSSYYDDPYLMEDFLYEKPFINLALSDSRTMDSLARNQSATLNPNCYFESDSLQKVPLCEVGLYGSRDSIIVDAVKNDTTHVYNSAVARVDSNGNVVYDSVYYGSYKKLNYSEFRNSPLKFKAESDWYKVGVKVDRWERVDGLHPDGSENKKGVPIRHVERYSVPDIVVDGYIEKYSFVVDDLMPHRMRQIKMTFNSKEEIAWECNVTKAEDDSTACAVYTRKVGGTWALEKSIGNGGYVAHPIKKNGRFDFDASKYFSNLANIQKDNQNTVMISMVNKIGLSNTQRFYV